MTQGCPAPAGPGKFRHPEVTADGAPRARVGLDALRTLWVNTGTVCNLSCLGCYIESTPRNDRLAWFRPADLGGYLDEIAQLGWATGEIGFTGGEPFTSPHIVRLLELALERGFRALVLTNAMTPLTHKRGAVAALHARFPGRLTLRVSLDHYTEARHEALRGAATWRAALDGLSWAAAEGLPLAVAGRAHWGEPEAAARAGYGRLFAALDLPLDATDPGHLVIFPEMEAEAAEADQVPEITTACWDILGRRPDSVMCASARMAVRHKGAAGPRVLACTLIAYDDRFDLGATLAEAAREVPLTHPHCARFCVLGGARCS
jgi:hypothetical protein